MENSSNDCYNQDFYYRDIWTPIEFTKEQIREWVREFIYEDEEIFNSFLEGFNYDLNIFSDKLKDRLDLKKKIVVSNMAMKTESDIEVRKSIIELVNKINNQKQLVVIFRDFLKEKNNMIVFSKQKIEIENDIENWIEIYFDIDSYISRVLELSTQYYNYLVNEKFMYGIMFFETKWKKKTAPKQDSTNFIKKAA